MTYTGYAFDIYAYNDLGGSRLVRLTPEANSVELGFRKPEQGFSMQDGQIHIHSAHAAATTANFHRHNLVKVVWVVDDVDVKKCGGWLMEEGDFAAVSNKEAGGRMLSYTGPNTVYYLERAKLREQPFSENPAAGTVRGSEDVDGMWTWIDDGSGVNAEPGGIMVRGLEEGFYEPGPGGTSADAPLADATWDFTRFQDSNGVGWTAQASHWQLRIGTSILDLLLVMLRAGLFWRSGADLDYHAYASDPSVDRTATTFATGKVRFEAGINIGSEVRRATEASIDRSANLVLGADNTTAYVEGGVSDVTWIGVVDAGEAADEASLERLGQTDLDDREVRVDSAFPVKHIVGDDEEAGLYVPFVHYEPGDIVTLNTVPPGESASADDFDDFAINVAAVRIMHDSAGNWFGMPELGAQSLSAESRAFEERVNRIIRQPGGHSHPPNPQLCQPASAATEGTENTGNWQGFNVNTGTSADLSDGDTSDGSHMQLNPWSGGSYFATDAGAGVEITIGRIRVHHTSFSDLTPVSFDLRASDVGAVGSWSDEVTLKSFSDPLVADWVDEEFTPHTARYFRLVNTGGAPPGSDALDGWAITEIETFTFGTIAGSPNDGHADLVGTSVKATRCDHRHDVHRDAAPTANDDEDAGYKVGTVWAVMDDLESPTAISAVYVAADVSEGAAVWLAWPGGGTDLSAINFLVGTASGLLSNEIVAGTSPGGELGGTWASPTVDATHSGSTHAATQAAAEATAATALSGHTGDTTDAHDASAISFSPVGTIAGDDVQEAVAEVATDAAAALTAHAATSHGGIGPILVASVPAGTPLVFSDLLQNSDGTDLLYASEP